MSACLVFLAAVGCMRPQTTTPIVTECVVEADQSATVTARWPVTPVPLQWHTSFSSNEVSAMKAAATTWNTFYKRSKKFPLFDTSAAQSSDNITSVCTSGTSIVNNDKFTGKVHIFKRSTWSGSGYDPLVIALTTVCSSVDPSGSSLKRITNAMMESNYQNFFVSGKLLPDTQSIYLHEFGHLVGLDHSCEVGSTRTGMPNCNKLASTSHPYWVASLFPKIFFPDDLHGEVRRVLQANDMGRANCLYEDTH